MRSLTIAVLTLAAIALSSQHARAQQNTVETACETAAAVCPAMSQDTCEKRGNMMGWHFVQCIEAAKSCSEVAACDPAKAVGLKKAVKAPARKK